MFRRELLEWLRNKPYTLSELALRFECKPRDVEEDLRHLERSLGRQGLRLVVDPARCRHCGFTFSKHKLRKPGKCPRCRHTWIEEPRVWVDQ